jgi:hypothetical protein
MAVDNYDELLRQATEIAQHILGGQGNDANRSSWLQIMHLVEQLTSTEAKIVALLNYAMQDETISLDYLTNQGFPGRVTESLYGLRPLEAESYEEYLDRVMSSPISLEVKIATMSSHLAQVKQQTPHSDDQSKQVAKQESVLKRLKAALEWHMGRTIY